MSKLSPKSIKDRIHKLGVRQVMVAEYIARRTGTAFAGDMLSKAFHGKRKLYAEEAEAAVELLDQLELGTPAELMIASARPAPADISLPDSPGLGRNVPVRGTSGRGAPFDLELNSEVVEQMERPKGLETVKDAFAFYMVGETMSPWREDGKIVFVHPARPPRVGNHVLVIMKAPPGEPNPCYIKKLVGRDEKRLRLAQYNPPRDNIYADLDKVERVLTVIEADELLGLPR